MSEIGEEPTQLHYLWERVSGWDCRNTLAQFFLLHAHDQFNIQKISRSELYYLSPLILLDTGSRVQRPGRCEYVSKVS